MARNPDAKRNAAVGCFVTPLGALSAAMVGVLLSMVVEYFVPPARACPDIPSCNWYVYAGIGAVVGGLTLPVLVLWRLFRGPTNPAARDEPAVAPDANSSF